MGDTNYFNLVVSGIGYLNRVREIDRGDQSFMACSIAALRGGGEDKPEYTYFDCTSFNDVSKKLLHKCMQAVAQEKKVLIAFKLNNLSLEIFTYEKGEKKGQTGCRLKAILTEIRSIKMDGEEKYRVGSSAENAKPAPESGHTFCKLQPAQVLATA